MFLMEWLAFAPPFSHCKLILFLKVHVTLFFD